MFGKTTVGTASVWEFGSDIDVNAQNKFYTTFQNDSNEPIAYIIAHINSGWAASHPFVKGFIYDANGNLLAQTEERLLTWTGDFARVPFRIVDANGNPTTITLPLGKYRLGLIAGTKTGVGDPNYYGDGYGAIHITSDYVSSQVSDCYAVRDLYADGIDPFWDPNNNYAFAREFDIYAALDTTEPPPPPPTGPIEEPPQPPPPLDPPIPNVDLVYETDFRYADYDTPYRLKGLGVLDGSDGNYINDGGLPAVKTYFKSYPDGQKAFCIQQLNDTDTDRVEFNLFLRSVTKKIVGRKFLISRYMFIPTNYVLGSPTDKWLIIDAINSALDYLPKWQTLFLSKSPAHPEVTTTDLLIDHHTYPPGSGYYYLVRKPNFLIPVGRWFRSDWYQDLDTGRIKLWIDKELIFDIISVPINQNPANTEGYFYTSVAKLYGDPGGTFPREMWIANIKLYNVTEAPPTPPLPIIPVITATAGLILTGMAIS